MRNPAAASAPTTVGPLQPERGMCGDAGRLVDDDEVVVVVHDAEIGHGDRFDLERAGRLPAHLEPAAGAQPVGLVDG